MKETSDHWQKLKEIFSQVNELAPESRSAFLSQLRFNQKTIFEEISALLEAKRESEDFLRKPLIFDEEVSFIGETVGHYRIVREIGRGGMGAVFEAVREDGEFDQKAAVKLTNRNLFSDELIKRFRTERQILAKLEHKNIVRLLDGGITANHIPYFVMEYVEGASITDFCAENALGIDERLALFLQVCEAVSYAHRGLIVHRDLKPSNILVTKNGEVKLLDFGIAKILDSEAQTQTANAPFTPEYASPEQIKGETITTASDIYSLGVILYELLTEKTPAEIYGVERAEIWRGVCESEPVRPSSVVLRSSPSKDEKFTDENKGRKTKDEGQKTNPKSEIRNPKSLKGDLDNIILKCLQKEKDERYASVEQFADDIKAHLQGLPVKAHPQSFGYRARKFIKRNRLAVSIAAASLFLILAAAGIAVWQAFSAQRQQKIAEQNFNQVRKIANSLILDYHDEIAKLDGSTKLREKLVADALEYLDAISAEETENVELLKEMAIAYRKIGAVQGMPYAANLGKPEEAVKNYEKSIALLEKAIEIAPENLSLKDEIVKSYNEIAQVYGRLGKINIDEIYLKAIEIIENAIRLDDTNIERKIYRLRLKIFAADFSKQDAPELIIDYKKIIEEAEILFPQAAENVNLVAVIAIASERIGKRYRSIGLQQREEGFAEAARNSFEQAAQFSVKSLEYMNLRRKLDPNDSQNKRRVFVANLNLCTSYIYLKNLPEAEKYQKISEDILADLYKSDPENKQTLTDELSVLKNKVEMLMSGEKFGEAFGFSQKGIESAEKNRKEDSSNPLSTTWIGYFYERQMEILKAQGKNIQNHERVIQNLKNEYLEKFKKEISFSGYGL